MFPTFWGIQLPQPYKEKNPLLKLATMTEIVCEQGGKVRRAGRFSYPTLSPYRWSHSKPGPSWPF